MTALGQHVLDVGKVPALLECRLVPGGIGEVLGRGEEGLRRNSRPVRVVEAVLREGEEDGRPAVADDIRGTELAGQVLAPGAHVDGRWGCVDALHDERVGWEAAGILHVPFLTDGGSRGVAHPSG